MKNNNQKITEEAIAFLPDAIEIKNERLPLWARYSVIFSLIFFLGAILWASLGKVDVVVKAGGKLISDKHDIVMKPLERSVIDKIHVRIGQIVEKNELLITFDPTLTKADALRLKNEIIVLSAKYDRFKAEFDEFYSLLKGGEQRLSYEDFIAPVFVMNAVNQSLESKREVVVREFEI